MTRADLLRLHDDLSRELAECHRVLGVELGRERRIKTDTYLQASGSDKERSNVAQFNALDITEIVFKTQRECDALTVELDNIRLQLAYGGFTE